MRSFLTTCCLSHSTRVRGLKSPVGQELKDLVRVALYTSAWIEISSIIEFMNTLTVALYTSAWIEISCF